jgi:flagellar motor switch/type III secretory pathway protein FliN
MKLHTEHRQIATGNERVSETQGIVEIDPPKDPWGPLVQLSCSVTVEIELPQITVGTLLQLQAGTVLSTQWRTNRDLPVQVNERLLAWGEFDSGGEALGIRITEFLWDQQQS